MRPHPFECAEGRGALSSTGHQGCRERSAMRPHHFGCAEGCGALASTGHQGCRGAKRAPAWSGYGLAGYCWHRRLRRSGTVRVSISTVGRIPAPLKVRGMLIEPDRQPAPVWKGAAAKELLDRAGGPYETCREIHPSRRGLRMTSPIRKPGILIRRRPNAGLRFHTRRSLPQLVL